MLNLSLLAIVDVQIWASVYVNNPLNKTIFLLNKHLQIPTDVGLRFFLNLKQG